jgi:hypothetical protein
MTKQKATSLTGTMFLYERPELLNPEVHAGLGIKVPTKPFEFAAGIKAVPIVASEISSAQKHYPIVFSSMENPMPLAVVGILEEQNLFVGADGKWDTHAYVPAYLRCYPFALAAATGQDQSAVVIDAGASRVTKEPDFPFFKDGAVTAETNSMIDFCSKFAQEMSDTTTFCQRLKALDLLAQQTATNTAADGKTETTVAQFITLDMQKVNNLPPKVLQELLQNAYLGAIFAQAFSMENWTHLINRRLIKQGINT